MVRNKGTESLWGGHSPPTDLDDTSHENRSEKPREEMKRYLGTDPA